MALGILIRQSTLNSFLAARKENLPFLNTPIEFKHCMTYVNWMSPTHDLARYIKGLRPEILENMNHYNTIQKAYSGAIRVKHTLQQSHMR